jgi:hypothetical protein
MAKDMAGGGPSWWQNFGGKTELAAKNAMINDGDYIRRDGRWPTPMMVIWYWILLDDQ